MKEWMKRKLGTNSNDSKRFSQHSEYQQRIAQTGVDNQKPVSSWTGLKNMSPQNASRDQSSSLDDEMGHLAYREYTFEPRKKSISSMKQRLKNAIFRHRARSVTSQEHSTVDDNSATDPFDFLTNPRAISDIGSTYRSFNSIDDSSFVETNQNEGLSIDSHIVTSLENPKKPVIEFVNKWYDPESSSPDSPKFKQSLDYGSEEDLTLPSEYKFTKRYRLPSLSRRPEFSRSVSEPAPVSTIPDNAVARSGSGQEYLSQMADPSLSSPFVLDRVINSDPVSEKISLKLAARDRNSSVRIGVPSSTNSMSNNDSSSITPLEQSKKRESYEDKYSATSSDEAKYSIRTDSSPEYGMLKNVSTDRSVNLETKMDTVIRKKKEMLYKQCQAFKDLKPLVPDALTTVKDRSFGIIANSALEIANRYFIQLDSRVDTVTEVNPFDEALRRLKEGATTFATTLNESRIPVQDDDMKMGIVQELNSLIRTCINESCVNVIKDCSDGLQLQTGRELEYLDNECKKLISVQSKLVQLTDLQESLSQTLDPKIGDTMYQKLYHLGIAIQDDERLCSLMDPDAKVFRLINLISNDMEKYNHGEGLKRIIINSIVLELELCDTQKYCSRESRNAMDTFFTECAKYKSSYLKYTGLQNDILSILTNSHKPKKIFPHQSQSQRVSKISDLRPDDSWIKRIPIHGPINQPQAQRTSKRSNIKPDDSWIKKNNASLINSTMKRTTSGLFDSF